MEEISKGSTVGEPVRESLETGMVVPMPTLVPSSKIIESSVVETPVYLTKKLLAPLPDSLLLKVPQSVLDNWPVLAMEAVGILITRALVEVVMLKMLPKVPVEALAITLLPRLMEVEVPISTCSPPEIDRLLPTVRLPKVVVPMPPLEACKTPDTSEELRFTLPMFNSPPTDLTTPVPKEERVVLPEGLMVNRDVPVWLATEKGLTEP